MSAPATDAGIERFNWIVTQVTAREHYAVPRAFHSRNHLEVFYTDIWCRYGEAIVRRAPGRIRALAGRFHPDLPADKVVSFTFGTVGDALSSRAQRGEALEATYHRYVDAGRAFCERVNRRLDRLPLRAGMHSFFGYDTGCLETLQLLRAKGVTSVVDQIDPARVEEEIVFQESLKWPGWQRAAGRIPDAYFRRLSQEWDLASLVLVNSQWSREGLVRQGVAPEKIIVVPLAYEPPQDPVLPRAAHGRPLTVLWLGSVILRKGIQYLIAAANALKDSGIRFVVGGDIGISRDALATAPPGMSFIGRVTRDRAPELFRQADAFVLPTLSDGFAITQLEAMAHGLPVIATPNCGDVVTDGVDGLIVPAGDADALAAAIARFDADRGSLHEMSRQALVKSKRFSLDHYAGRVEAAVSARLGSGT